jgi:hypothetical protein
VGLDVLEVDHDSALSDEVMRMVEREERSRSSTCGQPRHLHDPVLPHSITSRGSVAVGTTNHCFWLVVVPFRHIAVETPT